MNLPAVLVACYPPPVRERWGEQMQTEVAHTAPLRWVNVAGGAAGLWLNPAVWPAPTSRQRRAVLTVTGAVILGAAALLLRAVAAAPDGLGAAIMTAALGGLGVGGLLLCPVPPLHRDAVMRMTRQATGALWIPGALIAALIAFANQPGTDALLVNPVIRAVGMATYWFTLVLGVVQMCRLCSSLLTGAARPPASWRVRAGLRISATSLVIAAVSCLTATNAGHATMLAVASLLVGLAVVALRNSATDIELG